MKLKDLSIVDINFVIQVKLNMLVLKVLETY